MGVTVLISKEAAHSLSLFEKDVQYPENKLPNGVDLSLISYLVSQGWLAEARLPPEGDPDFPYGVRLYKITSAGIEVLNQFREKTKEESEQKAKEKRRALWGELKFWIGLFLGWLLGGFTPKEVFRFLFGFFQ